MIRQKNFIGKTLAPKKENKLQNNIYIYNNAYRIIYNENNIIFISKNKIYFI